MTISQSVCQIWFWKVTIWMCDDHSNFSDKGQYLTLACLWSWYNLNEFDNNIEIFCHLFRPLFLTETLTKRNAFDFIFSIDISFIICRMNSTVEITRNWMTTMNVAAKIGLQSKLAKSPKLAPVTTNRIWKVNLSVWRHPQSQRRLATLHQEPR